MRRKVSSVVISLLLFFGCILFPSLAFAGNPPDQANSSLSATEVPADGSSQSKITVTHLKILAEHHLPETSFNSETQLMQQFHFLLQLHA